jgi:protein O-mannosyl-transferase
VSVQSSSLFETDRLVRVGTVLLFLTVALLYGALGLADFVWDDIPLIVQNRITGDLANWPLFFTQDLWLSSGISGGHASGYYRPLMLLSLAIDQALWGLSPAGHHLHSVAWHLGASAVLLVLLRQLVPPLPALLGAGVFALHPLQSEAVAWVASRNDPMVTLFVLAAVLVLLPRDCGRWRLVMGGLLVLAATLSKESGVLAPVLLGLLDLARWRRPGGLARYGAMGLALAVWFALRQGAGVHVSNLPDPGGVALLFANLHRVVASYGLLVLAPWPLSTGRTLELLHDPPVRVALGLCGVVLLAIWQVWRGRALGAAGLIFSLVAVAPPLVAIAGKGQLGERYLYLALAGLALGVAASLPARSRWLWLALPVAAGWTGVLHQRLPQWQNALDLWASAAENTPSGYAFTGYAHELNRAGRAQEAQEWFIKAVHDPPPMADACANVLRGPLALDQPQIALDNARMLKGKGCGATPDFMGVLAEVFARNCLWDEVAGVLDKAEGDTAGRSVVLMGAMALQQDAHSAYAELSHRLPDGPQVFRQRVQQALDQGCRGDLVAP